MTSRPQSGFNLNTFDLRPLDLKRALDEYVVGQERAKVTIATTLCAHYRRLRHEREYGVPAEVGERAKSNILLIGPTGSGKTFLITAAARLLGVPFSIEDATMYTESGYVGEDIDDIPRNLVVRAGGDVDSAQLGIVYVDEIDKLAEDADGRKGVSRRAVQEGLLKILEGTTVDLYAAHSSKRRDLPPGTINTRNILFIASGAFQGLAEIMNRGTRRGVGFGAQVASEAELEGLTPGLKDLRAYGFIDEFMGRFPVITTMDRLDEAKLYQILNLPTSPIMGSKVAEFQAYGIELTFEEQALRFIAARAFKGGTGARALKGIVDDVLMPFLYSLPSTDVKNLLVTEAMVKNPQATLDAILAGHPLRYRVGRSSPTGRPAFVRRINFPMPREYLGQLVAAGVAEPYLDAAVQYGTTLQIMPPEIPAIIRGLEAAVDQYQRQFRETHHKRLEFTLEAQRALVNLALQTGRSMETIIYSHLGMHLEQGTVLDRIRKRTIRIDETALSDPANYVQRLSGTA